MAHWLNRSSIFTDLIYKPYAFISERWNQMRLVMGFLAASLETVILSNAMDRWVWLMEPSTIFSVESYNQHGQNNKNMTQTPSTIAFVMENTVGERRFSFGNSAHKNINTNNNKRSYFIKTYPISLCFLLEGHRVARSPLYQLFLCQALLVLGFRSPWQARYMAYHHSQIPLLHAHGPTLHGSKEDHLELAYRHLFIDPLEREEQPRFQRLGISLMLSVSVNVQNPSRTRLTNLLATRRIFCYPL